MQRRAVILLMLPILHRHISTGGAQLRPPTRRVTLSFSVRFTASKVCSQASILEVFVGEDPANGGRILLEAIARLVCIRLKLAGREQVDAVRCRRRR